MNILSENDFLDEKLDVETIKVQIQSLLGIELKTEWKNLREKIVMYMMLIWLMKSRTIADIIEQISKN